MRYRDWRKDGLGVWKEIRAVIFDMDGVLADSQPFHFEVDALTLKRAGVDAPVAVVHAHAGMTNPDRFADYKRLFGLPQAVGELIASHVATIMTELDSASLAAVNGAPELLALLERVGVPMAVASSSSYAFIYKMLDKLGLRAYFKEIVSGEDMERGKPAPDIFLKAAEVLGVAPERCAVIEDSGNGVLAAKAAGMYCIGYRNPTSGAQDLSAADLVTGDFFELAAEWGRQLVG